MVQEAKMSYTLENNHGLGKSNVYNLFIPVSIKCHDMKTLKEN